MEWGDPKFDESKNPNISHDAYQFGEIRALLGYFLLTVVVVFLLVEGVVWSLPHTVSLERERNWFGFVQTYFDSEDKFRTDDKLQKLANQLAPHMGLPENSISVYYSQDGTPNAFATFGGNIVMNRGLLERLPNEESVATVLAHEMAHIQHRDPLRGMSRSLLYSLVAAMFGSDTQMQALANLEGLRYSRELEYQADAAALDAVQKHYQNAQGAQDLFTVFLQIEQEYGTGRRPTWLSTHPATDERMAHIRRRIEQLDYRQHNNMHDNPWRNGE